MSEIGKAIRLGQITNPQSGKMVIVAMDHCPAIGPCEGMIDPVDTVRKVCAGKPDSMFMHKGNIKKVYPILIENRMPFLLSISTATFIGPAPSRVYLVDTVEYASQIGASGVSMRIFVGPEYEREMIMNLGKVSAECEKYGLVLQAMMYPNGFDNDFDPKYVKHAARIGAELGADIVKTYYTGDSDSFSEVTESCPVPIVMSGGPKTTTAVEFLETLKGAMDGGAAGVAVGRNVWQYKSPEMILEAVKSVVHDGEKPQKAAAKLV
ncbi:MAG: 2-amino-3,7-dideoxy-D-threo-hept-6-ulosonate synthase [Anaerolineales bacterium]|jgi:DhnA family fructose-bisphosphate aldolase class Ia